MTRTNGINALSPYFQDTLGMYYTVLDGDHCLDIYWDWNEDDFVRIQENTRDGRFYWWLIDSDEDNGEAKLVFTLSAREMFDIEWDCDEIKEILHG